MAHCMVRIRPLPITRASRKRSLSVGPEVVAKASASRFPSASRCKIFGIRAARSITPPDSHSQIVSDETLRSLAICSWVKPSRARCVFSRSAVKVTFRPGFPSDLPPETGSTLSDVARTGGALAISSFFTRTLRAWRCFFNAAMSERCNPNVLRNAAISSRNSLRATRAITFFRDSAKVRILVAAGH